jgi:hypothetical protein
MEDETKSAEEKGKRERERGIRRGGRRQLVVLKLSCQSIICFHWRKGGASDQPTV